MVVAHLDIAIQSRGPGPTRSPGLGWHTSISCSRGKEMEGVWRDSGILSLEETFWTCSPGMPNFRLQVDSQFQRKHLGEKYDQVTLYCEGKRLAYSGLLTAAIKCVTPTGKSCGYLLLTPRDGFRDSR